MISNGKYFTLANFSFFHIFVLISSLYNFCFSTINAQVNNIKQQDSLYHGQISSVNSTEAEEGDIKIKDGSANTLLRITDEGTFGAIEIKSGTPSTTTNKLYNNGGILKFNGTTLGGSGATSINDLSDAKYIGSSLFLGLQSGFIDDGSDNRNTALGQKTLLFNSTGSENVAIGYESMIANQIGNKNTAIGYASLYSNEVGFGNTAIGNKALLLNVNGNYNTAVGWWALENNIGSTWVVDPFQGNYNVGIGYKSLNSNTTGKYNTACGSVSLSSNTTADGNTAFGYTALLKNVLGDNNTALGASALYNNGEGATLTTEGASNIALGIQALFNNTLGSYNVGIGNFSNRYNQSGSYNTIIGHEAGSGIVSHSKNGNIFIGYQAGFNESGDDKLYIENSNSSSPLIWGDFANNIAAINGDLGIGIQAPSDKVHIVASSGQDALRVQINSATKLRVFSNGGTSIGSNYSATPANGLYVAGDIQNSSGVLHSSDIRFKKNIAPIKNVLEDLDHIRGIYYDWKVNEFPNRDFSHEKQIGVIAQEVEKIFPELVRTSVDGYKSVNYSKLTPILLEAVKELKKNNSELENRLSKLELLFDTQKFTRISE